MIIHIKQIDQNELFAFVTGANGGGAVSGQILGYVNGSGYLGPNILYISGGIQSISGTKYFLESPFVPSPTSTGHAVNRLYFDQSGRVLVENFSGFVGQFYVPIAGNTTISGYKTFENAITIGIPTGDLNAATLGLLTGSSGQLISLINLASGTLQTGINNITISNVVYQTGNQTISGTKTFVSPISIGSPATSGHATTKLYVDIISGVLQTGLSNVSVSNVVYQTGDQIISGLKTFTGAVAIGSATQTGHAVTKLYVDTISGVLSSGNISVPNVVTTTGNELIGGFKQFTGSPFVPVPTQYSGAANYHWVTGISGALNQTLGATINTYYITGTGVVAASSNASGDITNNFTITSGNVSVINSGTATNTYNITNGNANTIYDIAQVTGNFVNMSFFFDEYNLSTGLNIVETFVSRDFQFTGYALGLINSGTSGNFLSGSIYQRNSLNAKTAFLNFSINSGVLFTSAGGFNQTISGLNRVGVDIYKTVIGMTGLTIGLFGFGY